MYFVMRFLSNLIVLQHTAVLIRLCLTTFPWVRSETSSVCPFEKGKEISRVILSLLIFTGTFPTF